MLGLRIDLRFRWCPVKDPSAGDGGADEPLNSSAPRAGRSHGVAHGFSHPTRAVQLV